MITGLHACPPPRLRHCQALDDEPSGKQLAILDLVRDRVIVVPPRAFRWGRAEALGSQMQHTQELSRRDVSYVRSFYARNHPAFI